MKLTETELKCFLGYLKARQLYHNPAIHQEWMVNTIRKLEDELYLHHATTHNWK